MKRLVEKDISIEPLFISYSDAVEYFNQSNRRETSLLLENWNRSRIEINRCGTYQSLYHGPMVESTGILKIWDLILYEDGFQLCFAPSSSPLQLAPYEEPVKQLFQIYHEHKNWGKIRDVHCVGQLNTLSMNKRDIENFINVSEALHMQKIGQIAQQIYERKQDVKVVLIAGMLWMFPC